MTDSSLQTLLKDGIAAAKLARQQTSSPAGAASSEQIKAHRQRSRSLLARVLKMDPGNIIAWLYLSTVVETPQERKICFEKVLALDPDNKHARAGLATISGATSGAEVRNNRKSSNPDSASLREPAGPKIRSLPRIRPVRPESVDDATSDDSGCPFCGRPISTIDTTCPHCRLLLVMNCPACSEAVDVERLACENCGHTMGDYRQQLTYFSGLGKRYLTNRRFDDAIQAWLTVEELDDDFPQLHLYLGQAHLGASRPDRAIKSLQEALNRNPNSVEAHFTLGEMMRQRVSLEEAFDHYQTVIRLDPKHGMAWLRKAEIFEQVKVRKEAQKTYRKAIKLLPPDSEERRRAQIKLDELEPTLPEAMATGWLEFIRQSTGPILICLMAILFDSGLRPWWIDFSGWLALFLTFFSTFLFVSGASLPRNPLLQLIVGPHGLSSRNQKVAAAAVGVLFWLVALGLILLPINQSYPDIPDLQ